MKPARAVAQCVTRRRTPLREVCSRLEWEIAFRTRGSRPRFERPPSDTTHSGSLFSPTQRVASVPHPVVDQFLAGTIQMRNAF